MTTGIVASDTDACHSDKLLEAGHFFTAPDNLYRAVNNVYELAVLIHLLQRRDENGRSFPSQEMLTQGIMSKRQVARATDALAKRNIISMDRKWLRGGGIQINYTVNLPILISIVQMTTSPLDYQSTCLPVHIQMPTSHLVQMPTSPHNHIQYVNHIQLTTPNTSSISDEKNEKETFLEYRGRLEFDERYIKLDHRLEFEKCQEWCEEKHKKLSKRRWRNWLEKAIEIQADKERNNGHKEEYRSAAKQLPDRNSYTDPKELRIASFINGAEQ